MLYFACSVLVLNVLKWYSFICLLLAFIEPASFISFSPDLQGSMTYRRVKIKGEFDHSNELYLGPRPFNKEQQGLASNAVGFHVITPFKLLDSGYGSHSLAREYNVLASDGSNINNNNRIKIFQHLVSEIVIFLHYQYNFLTHQLKLIWHHSQTSLPRWLVLLESVILFLGI